MTIEVEEGVDTTMDATTYYHQFHAEGNALSGDLRAPIRQDIETQIPIELNDRRGGHLFRSVSDVSIEGLVSIRHAETRVSGSLIKGKWVTLATTILEGLNVFEVISVDRVIAQVSTSHAKINGHVPKVTFLGTKFENLQVSGIPVEITYNYQACLPPDNNDSHLLDPGFVQKASEWTSAIAGSKILFGRAHTQYTEASNRSSALTAAVAKLAKDDADNKKKGGEPLSYDDKVAALKALFPVDQKPKLTCSLVESINIDKVKARFPRVETKGNVIVIPDFGAVSLGEIEVGIETSPSLPFRGVSGLTQRPSTYFELTMLNMELGCIGDATLKAARSKTNGTTNP